jgi:hypothetical protein
MEGRSEMFIAKSFLQLLLLSSLRANNSQSIRLEKLNGQFMAEIVKQLVARVAPDQKTATSVRPEGKEYETTQYYLALQTPSPSSQGVEGMPDRVRR